MNMGIAPDGDSVKIKYSTLGIIAPFCGVLIYLSGWLSSHAELTGELTNLKQAALELRAQAIQSQAREGELHKAIIDDRFSAANRLVSIEGDIKRMVQDIAEIKAFPRRQ